MNDIHELKYLKDKVKKLKEQKVFRVLPVLEGADKEEIILDGKMVINLSSNNYLGFANLERIKNASINAIKKYGVGAGAVRTIVGNMDIHEELERKLAEFKREEAVMVFQSGYNCNLGTIQAITDEGDLIVSDELNHASIIDGIRLSKAEKIVFKHSDMNDLERILNDIRARYNNVIIMTDGVFSMDGDIAKLPEIVDIAEKYNCLTYVDDAHGSGVLGENGRGIVDYYDLHDKVDFIVGTLSKAVGALGGYVAGKKVMKDWLIHRGRPLLFSTSLPPSTIAAVNEAIDILMNDGSYQKKLWENSEYFKKRLKEEGFDISSSETPITPVMIGDEAKTVEFSKLLLEEGVFASPIVYPTVPEGTGRVRCMVTASHDIDMLERAVKAFVKVGKEMELVK